MNDDQITDFSSFSMLDLFRSEVELHVKTLTDGLLRIESGNSLEADEIKSLMRASHSIKGAARVVNLEIGVQIAHALEDCFVAAQENKIVLTSDHVDLFFESIDLIKELSKVSENKLPTWVTQHQKNVDELVTKLVDVKNAKNVVPVNKELTAKEPFDDESSEDLRTIRLSSENLNRLMGLSEEAIIEIHSLQKALDFLLKLKKKHTNLNTILEQSTEKVSEVSKDHALFTLLKNGMSIHYESGQYISDLIDFFESFLRRSDHLADRLRLEIIANRMRPFSEGVEGFPRMARDIAKKLGKEVDFRIVGGNISVDVDVLDMLRSPLNHLIRNAIDHGIESPEERKKIGKPSRGQITLEASHQGGMLKVMISDDGCGMDFNLLRQKIIDKGMVSQTMAKNLSESELLEFIFLPAFSSKKDVTEYSGRGVGLDVVYDMVQKVKGYVNAESTFGQGMQFCLRLPLTLSVVSALVVGIGDEKYSFPIDRIDQVLMVNSRDLKFINGKYYFNFKNRDIGVIFASDVFALKLSKVKKEQDLQLIVVHDNMMTYAVVVDELHGERSLVVNKLDDRLGKVPNISSSSILENGEITLIFDINDLVCNIENLFNNRHQKKKSKNLPRILFVDDSETVRKEALGLLKRHYFVETAVDGRDAWNTVRLFDYDLIITDIDMPRMSGLELIEMIKKDTKLQKMPIFIISYKEKTEDKVQAAKMGVNQYLTKESFRDGSFVKIVDNLLKK